jgi:hypothetical protein
MTQAIQRAENGGALVRRDDELTVQDLVEQVRKIQEVMSAVMHDGEHYGVIPGTASRDGKPPKKVLFKPGAEKLCLLFRFDPQYAHTEKQEGSHLTVVSTCTLFHIPTGQRRGSGMGMCTTKESKYAWRKAVRVCPECNAEAIIKGKEEYGGGWVCFKKKGGCGAKFKEGDRAIEKQETGRAPNEDIADTYNTVLKMANKRSLVAAVLNATAASDIFTQDLEDLPPPEQHTEEKAAAPDWHARITACNTLDGLKVVWAQIPAEEKKRGGLAKHKDNKKKILEAQTEDPERDAIEAEGEVVHAEFDE